VLLKILQQAKGGGGNASFIPKKQVFVNKLLALIVGL